MNKYNIAVAMSVYKTDTNEYVSEAIESIFSQSYGCFDLFIEVDGPISDSLRSLLVDYSNRDDVFVNFNSSNRGLATRLNQIIEKSLLANKYDFLARMDADDISLPQRFERQVEFLNSKPEVSVVGSDVLEISELGGELFHKKMDETHDEIFKK